MIYLLMAISEIDKVNSKQDEHKSQSHIESSGRRLSQGGINHLICHRLDASSIGTFSSFVTKFGTSFSVEVAVCLGNTAGGTGFDSVLKGIAHYL